MVPKWCKNLLVRGRGRICAINEKKGFSWIDGSVVDIKSFLLLPIFSERGWEMKGQQQQQQQRSIPLPACISRSPH